MPGWCVSKSHNQFFFFPLRSPQPRSCSGSSSSRPGGGGRSTFLMGARRLRWLSVKNSSGNSSREGGGLNCGVSSFSVIVSLHLIVDDPRWLCKAGEEMTNARANAVCHIVAAHARRSARTLEEMDESPAAKDPDRSKDMGLFL